MVSKSGQVHSLAEAEVEGKISKVREELSGQGGVNWMAGRGSRGE